MNHVQVVVTAPRALDAEGRTTLAPEELVRLDGYLHAEDRERTATGALLLRCAVGAHLGVDPADVVLDRLCPDCGRQHGRPRVVGAPSLGVSVAHAGGCVVVALHDGAPVGVDVEPLGVTDDLDAVADLALTERERDALEPVPDAVRPERLLRAWVRKEALVKATGDGLRADLAGIDVGGPEVLWERGPVHLVDVDLWPGHVGAVAVLGDGRPQVRVRQVRSPWEVVGVGVG